MAEELFGLRALIVGIVVLSVDHERIGQRAVRTGSAGARGRRRAGATITPTPGGRPRNYTESPAEGQLSRRRRTADFGKLQNK